MTPGGAVIGYNIPPLGSFTAIVCLAPGMIFIEAKAGPHAVPLAEGAPGRRPRASPARPRLAAMVRPSAV